MRNIEEEMTEAVFRTVYRSAKPTLRTVLRLIADLKHNIDENRKFNKRFGEVSNIEFEKLIQPYIDNSKDIPEIYLTELSDQELIELKRLLDKEGVSFSVLNDITEKGEDRYQMRILASGDPQTLTRVSEKLEKFTKAVMANPEKYHKTFETEVSDAKKKQAKDQAKKQPKERIKMRVKGKEL